MDVLSRTLNTLPELEVSNSDFIQHGPVRISALEIDRMLMTHPDVVEAVSFPVADPEFGESVAAAVVLNEKVTASKATETSALRGFLVSRLPTYKVPRRILFLDVLPRVGRGSMARALGFMPHPEPAGVFPIRPNGNGTPLFVVASLKTGIPLYPDRPVFGIREPELKHLELPHTVEHIAAECVRALRRFRPEGPYALSGCDSSGWVVLEMARQLEQDGDTVAFVALFDCPLRVNRIHRAWRFLKGMVASGGSAGLDSTNHRPWTGRVLMNATPEKLTVELDRISES